MGVSESVPLDPAFQTIASWPWSKVQSALNAFAEGNYDFCVDAESIANITCLSDADTNRLIKLLSHNNSGRVNALTLLVSIVLIGESSQTNVDIRLEALFDLIDFSGVASISMEESTILLIIISTAMASIVGKQDKIPTDKTLHRASCVIYEAIDKISTLPLLKSEFILWATSILDELPTNKLDTIFNLVFVRGVGITGNASKKQQVSDEPDLPVYRKEEQENDEFKGDMVSEVEVVSGNLLIKSIALSNIKGNDVYVTLRLGDGSEWAQSTDISPNRGVEDTQWKFDASEMSGNVNASQLVKNVINLTVKDSNEPTIDKYVGKAKLKMDDLLDDTNANKWVTLSGVLQSHDSENAGEYTVKAKFFIPSQNGRDVGDEEVNDDMAEDESEPPVEE